MKKKYYVHRWAALLMVMLSMVPTNNQVTFAAGADTSKQSPNIHAMIVSSSRYWFNYRHAMNALGVYNLMKQNGIPDENIILMIADEYAANSRNPYKNRMYASGIHGESWYSNHTEMDYRGSDVTVFMFLEALLGRAPKSLHTNADSNVLIYVTGHGGDQFFKFQDEEELTAQDIANVLNRMNQQQRFGQLLFIADTCQAFTLFDKVTTPNVLALGTSLRGENAYAHHSDMDLGLAVIERWTHAFLTAYNDKSKQHETTTLHDIMVAPFSNKNVLGAQVGIKEDTSSRKFRDIKLEEFFGEKGGLGWATTDIDNSNEFVPTVEPVRSDTSACNIQQDLARNLPRVLQSIAPTDRSFMSPTKAETQTLTCSSEGEKGVVTDLSELNFAHLFCGLIAVLYLATKLEQRFL